MRKEVVGPGAETTLVDCDLPYGSMQAVTIYDINEENRGMRHKPLPG